MKKREPAETSNLKTKSAAEKLKEQIASSRGIFRRSDFTPLDNDGRILERTFYESGETVQVHLSKRGKVQAVYLLKKRRD